ncbi:MAG: glycosyltransferase [Planctomycetes bacterium]|nr:glycosyltransferase [Planctomycetota bacterium]
MPHRLLTFNSHESWIFQLRHLDARIDIVDGLPGRATGRWDTRQRPVPPNAALIELGDFSNHYDCVLAHNVSDLLLCENLRVPKILILHTTLEHRARQENSSVEPPAFASAVRRYLEDRRVHPVAGTPTKARSWNLTNPDDALGLALDPRDFGQFTGDHARGLRVAHQIQQKYETLYYEFHENAFRDLPVRVVGHNPGMPGAVPAQDYEELLTYYRTHRFFIHTARPGLEDGYNMASAEAMAAGMPVLGNLHPTSHVEHGVSGFLTKTPDELATHAETLLNNRDLALSMGARARDRILQIFPVARFVDRLEHAIKTAKAQYAKGPRAHSPASS